MYVKHNDIERDFHATYRVAATVKSRKAEGVGTNQRVKEGLLRAYKMKSVPKSYHATLRVATTVVVR